MDRKVPVPAQESAASEVRESHEMLRILVVDDDETDRIAVRRSLQQSGVVAMVDETASADETLERIGTTVYDCILLDYYIPGVDGLALLQAICGAAPETPVVLFTGRGDEEIAVELMKAGAWDYLPKSSLTPTRVATSLRQVMEHARLVAERRRSDEERERLLIQAQVARAQAEAAVRARDDFVTLISHDLRNPLAVMQAQMQMVRRRTAQGRSLSTKQMMARLETIEAGIKRMSSLIDELQDATLLRAGHPLDLQVGPTDLVVLARDAAMRYRHLSDARRVRFETAVPTLVGVWDAARLDRALSNLLSNAIKYSPEGGGVTVKVFREADWATLVVEDHGIGIPEQDLAHIFDRYQRASNVSDSMPGTGLGLAGVREIVAQHGGNLAVQSEVGVGTSFVIRLPVGAS